MRKTRHSHFAVCIEMGDVGISIDPFLSDNPSGDNGWGGYLPDMHSTQGGDR
jgi:L-ascorbate metabolism protein UlaG (beta-lactamase superfamily)